VDLIGTLDGLYMDYVESMGSTWKPVGDCKVQKILKVIIYILYMHRNMFEVVFFMSLSGGLCDIGFET